MALVAGRGAKVQQHPPSLVRSLAVEFALGAPPHLRVAARQLLRPPLMGGPQELVLSGPLHITGPCALSTCTCSLMESRKASAPPAPLAPAHLRQRPAAARTPVTISFV